MAKPKKLTISMKVQKKITSLYLGNTKRKPMSVAEISKELNVPRRQIMFLLENTNLTQFSEGSYA